MSQPTRTPILIGERVVIVPPLPGAPVNFAGHTGRVIDFRARGFAYLVDLDGDMGEKWVDAECLERVAPHPELHDEPGYDAHLDAIEAAAVQRIRERATVDTQRALRGMLTASGTVLVTPRVALILKGGE